VSTGVGTPGDGARPDGDGFQVLAAIDLRGGRVVRLLHGDFDRETRYSDDPVATAERWVAEGATWLHVVDLDGAQAGAPRQAHAIARLLGAVGSSARCQVAGGLRSVEAVAGALDAGAARVVVGTAALTAPTFVSDLVERFDAECIVAALDVRDGLAVGEAWRSGATSRPVDDALDALSSAGLRRFAVTSIERDGALHGPDLGLLRRMAATGRGAILASGGIRSLADLHDVREVGAEGAIVGRALYEGTLRLGDALEALGRPGRPVDA
jgi:phosphoribosylformimino-5-aminoimidazole carboxamide ribotide isomerase